MSVNKISSIQPGHDLGQPSGVGGLDSLGLNFQTVAMLGLFVGVAYLFCQEMMVGWFEQGYAITIKMDAHS